MKDFDKRLEQVLKNWKRPEHGWDVRWVPCEKCGSSFEQGRQFGGDEKWISMPCKRCEEIEHFKQNVKIAFKDKEFVQCLKELMKEQ